MQVVKAMFELKDCFPSEKKWRHIRPNLRDSDNRLVKVHEQLAC